MGLIKCPECGHMISEYAEKCVSCGCPMTKIKEILDSQSNQKVIVDSNPQSKKGLLKDKLTPEEATFISNFKAFLLKNLSSKIGFADTDYYFGIKCEGFNGFPFSFKKPDNVLLFRYPSRSPTVFLTREIKSLDGKTASDLMGIIQMCIDYAQLEQKVGGGQKDNTSEVANLSKDEEDEDKTGPKFLDRVSTEEAEFISQFRSILRRAYRTVFNYRNNRSRYGIKHKESGDYLFWFKLKQSELWFVYKSLDGQKGEIKVDGLTTSSLNTLFSIVQKAMNPESQELDLDVTAYMKTNSNVMDKLNSEQRDFVDAFCNYIKSKYGNKITLSITNGFLLFKNPVDNRVLFWFKKKDTQCFFCTRKKDENKAKETLVESLSNKKTFSDSCFDAQAVLESYDVISNGAVIPEQSVLIKNKEYVYDTFIDDPFLNRLTMEQRVFAINCLNKINRKYGNLFDQSSNKSYFSISIKEDGEYKCVFAIAEGYLFFYYKAGIDEGVKDIKLETLDDQTISVILEKVEFVVNCARKTFLAAKNKSSLEEDKRNNEINQKAGNIYKYIWLEMIGNSSNITPSYKALCKNVKKYLLDTFNHVDKTKNFYDVIFASSVVSFFGHHLAWNKNEGIRSAKIVYSYFKAQTIMSKIKDYEEIFKKENQIITDYSALLDYLYKEIYSGEEVNYQKAPGLSSDFSLVPEEVLTEILNNFKAYEND